MELLVLVVTVELLLPPLSFSLITFSSSWIFSSNCWAWLYIYSLSCSELAQLAFALTNFYSVDINLSSKSATYDCVSINSLALSLSMSLCLSILSWASWRSSYSYYLNFFSSSYLLYITSKSSVNFLFFSVSSSIWLWYCSYTFPI